MSNLKFSVVIPVYNCEDTIRSCLDSILLSNQAELEVVAVDDGSSDQSGAVLDQYARKDPRLHVIHQNNMGNSFSRDTAVQNTTGDYILFVDADDELEPHAVDQIAGFLKDLPDILIFGFTSVFTEEHYSVKKQMPDRTFSDAKEAAVFLLEQGGFNLLWNKCWKASLIRGYHDFPAMKTTGQDFIFNCHVFPRAGSVISCSRLFYRYEKRSRETMVTRYLQDGYGNLKRKEIALEEMLHQFTDVPERVLADYMIREYEVYTINLFSPKCPLSAAEKKEEIRKHILSEPAFSRICMAHPISRYSALFQRTVKTGNAGTIVRVYSVLCWFRDSCAPVYRRVRRIVNS